MNRQLLRIGILASGRGSNLQAILDACREKKLPAKPVVVISNNASAGALERAARAGIATCYLSARTHPSPEYLDRAVRDTLLKYGVDLVVLAGYMKKLGPETIAAFRNRIVNIHPALLPKFGGPGMFGMHVHEAVIASGEKESGATVHLVDEEYDRGKILAQESVPVQDDDTPETLAARVLEVEHRLYVDTLRRIAEGSLEFPQD